jgi:hypothetical protein
VIRNMFLFVVVVVKVRVSLSCFLHTLLRTYVLH